MSNGLYLTINNPNSPGAMFSDNTEKCLVDFWNIIYNLKQPISYKVFQTIVKNQKITTSSYVRSLFPLLKYSGIINDYDKADVISSSLFTTKGVQFVCLLSNIISAKKQGAVSSVSVLNTMKEMQYFNFLVSLTKNNDCGYALHLKAILEFLKEFGSIDEVEFKYICYILGNNKSFTIDDNLKKTIQGYRNGVPLEIKVKVKDSQTKNAFKYVDKTNCFTYFLGIIKVAGLVEKDKKSYIKGNCTQWQNI